MLLTILAAALLQGDAPPEPAPDCSYDYAAMLELDWLAFDQDLNGGWRPLSHKGCDLEAAELIRQWRFDKREHKSVLYWHEGQLRALAGQTDEAMALFRITYAAPEDDASFGWNYYVSGTIAFLTRDLQRLRAAIAGLKQVPRPADLNPDFSWPPNLSVLEGFERCWDRSYKEAYASAEC